MLYQLFNNNFILIIMKAGVKEKLIKYNNKWLKKAIPNTIIYKKTYSVIIHSINKKTVNIIN